MKLFENKEREEISILQMAKTARVEPDQSQEPRAESRTPTHLSRTQMLES